MEKLVIITLIIILFALILKYGYKYLGKDIIEERKAWTPFYLKQKTMNSSEQAFYINLAEQLGPDYLIFSKVRVEDFVGVKHKGLSKGEHFGSRNRIKSRHVDFLVCDLKSTKPLLAIELDGSSHNNRRRIERDEMLDKVYTGINLKYVHVKVGSDFRNETERIKALLGGNLDQQQDSELI